jgi:hypothetical protein
MIRFLFLFSIVLMSSTLQAQKQLSSERFTLQSNALNVSGGQWQIESGFQYSGTSIKNFGQYKFYSPTVLQRYGISDRVELRLETSIVSNFAINKGAYTTNYYLSGFEAPRLGSKIKLLKQKKKFLPQIAVLGEVSLFPLASQIYRSKKVMPRLQFLFTHNYKSLSAGYHIGSYYNQRLHFTYDLYLQKKWGQRLISSITYAGSATKATEMGPSRNSQLYSSFGYYLSPNVLADFGAGRGVGNRPDFFYRAGLSFKLK